MSQLLGEGGGQPKDEKKVIVGRGVSQKMTLCSKKDDTL